MVFLLRRKIDTFTLESSTTEILTLHSLDQIQDFIYFPWKIFTCKLLKNVI